MGDQFPGEVTIHVPKGGHPALREWFTKAAEEHLDDRLHPDKAPALDLVLREGGTILLQDAGASYGNPLSIGFSSNADGPPPGFPGDVEYDAHSDAKYEFEAIIAFYRLGELKEFPSTQDGGILLDKDDVQRIIEQWKSNPDRTSDSLGAAILAATTEPAVSYEVGPHKYEIPY